MVLLSCACRVPVGCRVHVVRLLLSCFLLVVSCCCRVPVGCVLFAACLRPVCVLFSSCLRAVCVLFASCLLCPVGRLLSCGCCCRAPFVWLLVCLFWGKK